MRTTTAAVPATTAAAGSSEQALCQAIATYGRDLSSNPQRTEALLHDLCVTDRRGAHLLVSAQREGIAAELLSASALPRELLLDRLTKRLQDNLSVTPDAARWAVEAWAVALGLLTPEERRVPALSSSQGAQPNQNATKAADQAGVVAADADAVKAPPVVSPPVISPPVSPNVPPVVSVVPEEQQRGGVVAVQPLPSQSGNTSGTKGEVPPEVLKRTWNWGAFLLPAFWCFSHRLTGLGVAALALTLLVWLPGVIVPLLALALYLGFRGFQLGWQNRPFTGGIPEYLTVQRAWARWGAWIAIGSWILGSILYAIGKGGQG